MGLGDVDEAEPNKAYLHHVEINLTGSSARAKSNSFLTRDWKLLGAGFHRGEILKRLVLKERG